ncbi:GGDEF domain-containing protein [Marinomonas sp. TW1]|uniref:GGDEF domain-containing protein n=1 Tax=Marinomonas sp. TW1 TaxID=1561203 RepID=UPI0007AF1E4C|nr:GGDEF domain-containing protein [Marinomonas sp. TW1]KZN12637.1 diguanylate cyclase [Marinomonas sp. TW1]
MNRKPTSINFWFNDDHFREVILKGFLCVIGAASTILIVLNLFVGQTILALLEMVLLAFTIGVWFMPRHWRLFKWSVLFYVAFLFSGIIASIAFSPLFSGRQVWVLIFPVASYLMLGRRIAVSLSAVCLVMVSAIIINRFDGEYESYMRGILINLVLAYAFIWGLSHGAEMVIKRILEALRKIASTDPLTGLLNRRNIDTKFNAALQRKLSSAGGLGFVLIDVDHFKDVNDTYGHDVGDALLVDFAERLRSFSETDRSLYRLGGEEFCVWLPRLTCQSWSEAFCQYVHETPFVFQGHTIHYTISIGVVTSNQTTETFQRLYSLADKCLYQAKEAGRNNVVTNTL